MDSNNPASSNSIAGALTYPVRNDGALEPIPDQPRQPRNLQGLLRFAMEATKAEDAPGNSNLGPMDEERRKFLEDALKNLTVDVAQVLQNCIKILTDTERIHSLPEDQPLPEDIQQAFDSMLDYIEDIDIATDFYKLGGFAIFPICFGARSTAAVGGAGAALGALCQQNRTCQALALETGFPQLLLALLSHPPGPATPRCLFALSCATREYEPTAQALLTNGGCAVIAPLLRHPPTRTKAAFFMRHLCENYPEARYKFIKLNVLDDVSSLLSLGHDDSSEQLLGLAVALAPSAPAPAVAALRSAIARHAARPELADEACREEREHCRRLLRILPAAHEEPADR